MPPMIVAVVDCERLASSWPAQPVNTVSAAGIALVGVALLMLAVPGHRWYGTVVVLAGGGSIAFHGELTPLTEVFHDWSLALLVGAIALAAGATDRPGTTRLGALGAALAVTLALVPAVAEPLTLVLALVAVGREVMVVGSRSRASFALAAAMLSAGAVAAVLGREAGALCSPESPIQLHAVWHLLAGGALAAYADSRQWIRRGRDRVAG